MLIQHRPTVACSSEALLSSSSLGAGNREVLRGLRLGGDRDPQTSNDTVGTTVVCKAGDSRDSLCCPDWVKKASGEEEALELGLEG